jgi:hypothetical protein
MPEKSSIDKPLTLSRLTALLPPILHANGDWYRSAPIAHVPKSVFGSDAPISFGPSPHVAVSLCPSSPSGLSPQQLSVSSVFQTHV